MADMAWRPFRPRVRARTPAVPRSSPPSDRTENLETDDHREAKPSRVSSYISLGSNPLFPPEPLTSSTREYMRVNDEDKVWYNPSIEQMVEALQVNLMANGVLHPIPVEHNVYVLHLIEGFRHMQEKINAADAAREEACLARNQLLQDFETVEDEWATRETQYKAEVKRLEVILARTSRDGLEIVTLARAHSVVDRAGPDPRQFVTRLQKLRSQQVQPSPNARLDSGNEYAAFLGQVPSMVASVANTLEHIDGSDQTIKHTRTGDLSRLPSILDKEKDIITSQLLRSEDKQLNDRVHRQQRLHSRHRTTGAKVEISASKPPSPNTALQDSHLDGSRQRSYGQVAFESSSSSSESDDDGQGYQTGYTTGYLQPAIHHDTDVALRNSVPIALQLRTMDECQKDVKGKKVVQVEVVQGCNVSTGRRFSFSAGGDSIVHGDMCQEGGVGLYPNSGRHEFKNEATPYPPKGFSTEHSVVQRSDSNDGASSRVAAAVSALESPPVAGRNDGIQPIAKPYCRSSDGTRGNDMINYRQSNKPARNNETTTDQVDAQWNDYSHTNTAGVNEPPPVSRQPQGQSSAQLAASRAIQMRARREPHSGA